MVFRSTLLAVLAVLFAWRSPAQAANMLPARVIFPTAGPPAALCRAAAAAAEAALHVPDAFLSAIARVESGRQDPVTGNLAAWPWAVNAEGRGSFYPTKADAIAAVQALQASGVRSIDVGCLQVNLMHHPDAFASLEQAFDPVTNARYAAGFLVALFQQTGSWPRAAAAYHSQTPTIGAPYQRRVLAEWAIPDDGTDPAAPRPRRHADAAHDPLQAAMRPTAQAAQTQAAQSQAAQSQAATPRLVPPPPGAVAAMAPIGRMQPLTGMVAPPGGIAGPVGRGLATYRLMPIRLALRLPRPG